MTEKKKDRKAQVSIDLGFGGLFKGLAEFLDVLSDMAEKGEELRARAGEFEVEGLGKEAKGVYGFSVRSRAFWQHPHQ